jgi:hypothetical protein
MSDPQDPRRLSESHDGAFVEVLAGLEQARRAGPSAAQRERMRAALSVARLEPLPGQEQCDTPAAGARDASRASLAAGQPASKLRALLLKLGFGALLAGLAAAAAVWPRPRPLERVPPSAHGDAPVQATAPPLPPAPRQLPVPSHETPVPRAPEREPRRQAAHPLRPEPTLRASRVAAPASDPQAELLLLKQARADVRSNPERALRRAAEHASRFAHGAFAEEREVIAIEALRVLERHAEAEQRGAAFFRRFPDSAHGRRVRRLLADPAGALSHENPAAPPHQSN